MICRHGVRKRIVYDTRYNKIFVALFVAYGRLRLILLDVLPVFKSLDLERKRFIQLCNICRHQRRVSPGYSDRISALIRQDVLVFSGGYAEAESLRRTIILKNPVLDDDRVVEKGVMLITFTNSFEYFLREVDLDLLLSHYFLVLEPSWSGYCDSRILGWLRYSRHKIVVEATDGSDFEFLKSLKSNLMPVEYGASDWVDDRIFCPLDNVTKKYDAVYVAVYGKYKRHHVLFKAIHDMKHENLKVALIGVQWQGTRAEIDSLIDYYGIADNVDIFENLSPGEVNHVLNCSRVNLLLSLREGSNRSIFEGFFAGVPAIVLDENRGIQKKYINEMTGVLIREEDLGEEILKFRGNHAYDPHRWATDNISPVKTTHKLGSLLQIISQENGEPWRNDIAVKVNSPELSYYDVNDRSRFPAVADMIGRYRLRNRLY